MKTAGIGHIGVDAFFKGKLFVAAHVVALPVAGAAAAFAPIFFHIIAVDADDVGRAFVETGEIPAEHDKIRAHGKGQGDVMVIDNAAVGANGNVDAGFFKIFIPFFGDFDDGRSLTAADALLLPGDANGTAADSDFNEVGARFGKKTETVAIDDIAGADFHVVAVMLANPIDGQFLPFGKAFGRIDAENVGTGFDESGNPFGIIPGVDPSADDVAFVLVEKLVGIFFVGRVVFAKDKIGKGAVIVDNGKGVEFVFPDDVVGFLEGSADGREDDFVFGRHKFADFRGRVHAADAVITAGDNAEKLSVGCAVAGHGDSRVTGLVFEIQDVLHGVVGRNIGIRRNKTGFIGFDPSDHFRLVGNGLGTVNERDAAFRRQSDGHFFAGDRLHNGRRHRNVHGKRGFFFAFSKFANRCFKADVAGDAFRGRITGNEQIFVKSSGRFC